MPSDLPKPWSDLFDAAGGKHVVARECFTSETTVWRWSRGKTAPSAVVRELVNGLCDKYKVAHVFVPAEKEKEIKHA